MFLNLLQEPVYVEFKFTSENDNIDFIKHPEHENIIIRHFDTLATRVAFGTSFAWEKNKIAQPLLRGMAFLYSHDASL